MTVVAMAAGGLGAGMAAVVKAAARVVVVMAQGGAVMVAEDLLVAVGAVGTVEAPVPSAETSVGAD